MGKAQEIAGQLGPALGLKVDKETGIIYGHYEGYSTLLLPISGGERPPVIHVSVASPEHGTDVRHLKMAVKEGRALEGCHTRGTRVQFEIPEHSDKTLIADVEKGLNQATGFLKKNGYKNCCEICGRIRPTGAVRVENATAILCKECYPVFRDTVLDEGSEKVVRAKAPVLEEDRPKAGEKQPEVSREVPDSRETSSADRADATPQEARPSAESPEAPRVMPSENRKEETRSKALFRDEREASSESTSSGKKRKKKEHFFAGIFGALLGSLLGACVIVLMGRLDYVAAISGVVMAVATLKGYELLAGKLSIKGIVVSILLMVGMTYLGNRLDWTITVMRVTANAGEGWGWGIKESFLKIPELIKEGTIPKDNYLLNLLMVYGFSVIGAIPTIILAVRKLRRR